MRAATTHRLIATLALAVVGCSDPARTPVPLTPAPATPAPTPEPTHPRADAGDVGSTASLTAAVAPPADPMVMCDLGSRLVERAAACRLVAPDELEVAHASFARSRAFADAADADSAADSAAAAAVRTYYAVPCAVAVLSFIRDAGQRPELACDLGATRVEHAQVHAFVTAYFGQRTAVPTTGDATTDAALTALAAHRDAMCACGDRACLDRTRAALDADVPARARRLPDDHAAVADDAANGLVDDMTRCELFVIIDVAGLLAATPVTSR